MGEYTDGIERINIELSLAQQARSCSTRSRRSSRAATCRCGKGDDAGEIAARRAARTTASQQALALLREVRARWLATRLARRSAATDRHGIRAMRARREPSSTLLQDHTLRVSWKTRDPRAAAADLRRRARSSRSSTSAARSTSDVLRGRVLVALHMHAGDGNVHTNIPVNSRRLRDAADGARGGRAHHGAGARARRRDLGRARHRHHQARVPDRRRDRATSPTTSSASIRKAASTRASCCDACAALPADLTQRLHAELRPDGPRVADHAAERHRRDRRHRSRTACAAASASRCARPTCRAPTCSTARATRSSRPRC